MQQKINLSIDIDDDEKMQLSKLTNKIKSPNNQPTIPYRHHRKPSNTFLPFSPSHRRTCTSMVDLNMYLLPSYNNNSMRYTIIMSAGSGTRLNPEYPKPLHLVGNKPMLVHVFDTVRNLNTEIVLVLSNKNKDVIINYLVKNRFLEKLCDDIYYYCSTPVHIVIQQEVNGAGGAIKATEQFFMNKPTDSNILILCADTPLLTTNTINSLFNVIENDKTKKGVILTRESEQNYGYGRIVRNSDNEFVKIVEQKDTDKVTEKITLLNAGVYVFKQYELFEAIEKLDHNNASNEYYLTDCPEHITKKYGNTIELLPCKTYENFDETLGCY